MYGTLGENSSLVLQIAAEVTHLRRFRCVSDQPNRPRSYGRVPGWPAYGPDTLLQYFSEIVAHFLCTDRTDNH